MKLYDDSLVLAIWHKQLNKLAKNVLSHYTNGEFGLDETNINFRDQSDIHFCEVGSITDKLRKPQLKSRIKKLIGAGRVNINHRDLTFLIDTEQARDAHKVARGFWSSNGVPKGFDKDNKRCKTVDVPNIKELTVQCKELLMNKFKQIEWDQTYPNNTI